MRADAYLIECSLKQFPKAMDDDDDFPASYRTTESSFALPSHDLEDFLSHDLSVDRIEEVATHLWMVGRPQPPRPLNIQAVLNRAIIPTSDASLHLLWNPGKIYIKRLPSFFFTSSFYERHLQGPSLHGPALGLLFTYVSLVRTELDFELALQARLFSNSLKWKDWKLLSRRLIAEYPGRTIYPHLPQRYQYGELRLSRLNAIYRYLRGEWLYGYSSLTGPVNYAQFFSENLGVVAGTTVYIIVVLTAMQIGLATPELRENVPFNRACYGFAIFAIASPIAAIALIGLVFIAGFGANLWRAALAQRHLQKSSTTLSRDSEKLQNCHDPGDRIGAIDSGRRAE